MAPHHPANATRSDFEQTTVRAHRELVDLADVDELVFCSFETDLPTDLTVDGSEYVTEWVEGRVRSNVDGLDDVPLESDRVETGEEPRAVGTLTYDADESEVKALSLDCRGEDA